MTLLFTDSFDWDYVNNSKWTGGSGYTTTTTNARTVRCTTIGQPTLLLQRRLAAAEEHATMIMGLAVLGTFGGSTISTQCPFVFFSDAGATLHVAIRINAISGVVSAVRGDYATAADGGSGTLLGSSTATYPSPWSTWKYVEAKVTLHDTTGAVEVRIDGTTVLNLAGVDTKNAGTKTGFDTVGAMPMQRTSSLNGQADDFYCCNGAGSVNNDFLGPVKVESLLPNGNGNSSGLTNSAGNSTNNSTYVDDAAPTYATADYVQGVATAKDTYTFADSAQTPTTLVVKGVVVHAFAAKVDATAARWDTVARLSGTETTATPTNALTVTPNVLVWGVHETKPGGGAWTVADVNSAEFGLQAG